MRRGPCEFHSTGDHFLSAVRRWRSFWISHGVRRKTGRHTEIDNRQKQEQIVCQKERMNLGRN